MMGDRVVPTIEPRGLDLTSPETIELIRQAQESDAIDHQLTIRQALRKYKKACFWA
jgi:SP family general alpha glucoside:H+ symporter-like MFS transporter